MTVLLIVNRNRQVGGIASEQRCLESPVVALSCQGQCLSLYLCHFISVLLVDLKMNLF